MATLVVRCAVTLALVLTVTADVYLHNPRGTINKNRVDLQNNDQTNNQNRCFDSQNNAEGGYGVPNTPLYYYSGSKLMIEWTNQHGCGNENTNCQVVLQYLCSDANEAIRDGDADGANTNTYDADDFKNRNDIQSRSQLPSDEDGVAANGDNADRCSYEGLAWYVDCYMRERNKGLFLGDQDNVDTVEGDNTGDYATNTRQNPNGNQNGLECAEERDHWPYWHPTPFKDIAVFTSNMSLCQYYQQESGNVKDKGRCSILEHNNEAACTENGGAWEVTGSHDLNAPACFQSEFTRDNHLGNSGTGYASSYNWTIPDAAGWCQVRVRYNISSGDYDPYATDASHNGDPSPVQGNPDVNLGAGVTLQLAVDVTQFHRTFQDRSSLFEIRTPSDGLCDGELWNVNVRGRRGNIVESYPAVEYDFVPNHLTIQPGDCIHWQWTGIQPNNYEAGDAAYSGKAGQGDDVDISNIVQVKDPSDNYPMDLGDWTMVPDGTDDGDKKKDDMAMSCANSDGRTVDGQLNGAWAYCDIGVVQYDEEQEFHYMSSRNNAYTNRSQKGKVTVKKEKPLWQDVVYILAAIIGALLAAVCCAALFIRARPDSKLGQWWHAKQEKRRQHRSLHDSSSYRGHSASATSNFATTNPYGSLPNDSPRHHYDSPRIRDAPSAPYQNNHY